MSLHAVISGKEFNELYPDKTFIKLTNKDEIHNGFQFKTGLNIDTIQFNPTGECSTGGLYFCDENDVGRWIEYGNKKMTYYRVVKVLDDANIYIEEYKFKTDKFILGEKQSIFDNLNYCKLITDYMMFIIL